MNSHLDLTDNEFEDQFKTCTLDPTLFDHEAHLRLAWIHIRKYGLDIALENITTQLAAYVARLGAEEKFNKTLTVAAVKAVHHFINRSDKPDFLHFIQQHPRLKYNFKDLMAAHYGIDIYRSTEAKKEFLQPDLLPFDA